MFLTDKRKAYRVNIHIPITCELYDAQTKTTKKTAAVIEDISVDGIYFKFGTLVHPNTEIKVFFRLPHNKTDINAVIKIVRIETISGETFFGLGAIFVHVAETDKEDIRLFTEHLNINGLLKLAIQKGASDLHLLADNVPVLRINGELSEQTELLPFFAEELRLLMYSIMTKEQIRHFEREKELDFGIQYDTGNRFRINVHQQRGFIESTFRLISTKSFSFEELSIPDVVKDLARHKDGLVLIAGPTGSGKTTTIAAMIDLINRERKAVIITLERPIEYVHANIKSIVKQREIGVDTSSFSVALKSTLRQDPNVIVIGEMDDVETIKTALMAAEAGYLVIASFHAPDTVQGIDRLVSAFSPENRKQILFQLSNCLLGIISQVLLPLKNSKDRILVTEVLVGTDAAKKVIRNDQLIHLPTIMQTGGAYKMHLMADCIRKYAEQGLIEV
ncbi:MAG: PilT/PilU family type 4a pilus ATPase [Candidatus Omnitrophica bacterium]|nr:PilT/PilU family type 4a pilus ATPase [Candidatus Omnitrophota bacterium]